MSDVHTNVEEPATVTPEEQAKIDAAKREAFRLRKESYRICTLWACKEHHKFGERSLKLKAQDLKGSPGTSFEVMQAKVLGGQYDYLMEYYEDADRAESLTPQDEEVYLAHLHVERVLTALFHGPTWWAARRFLDQRHWWKVKDAAMDKLTGGDGLAVRADAHAGQGMACTPEQINAYLKGSDRSGAYTSASKFTAALWEEHRQALADVGLTPQEAITKVYALIEEKFLKKACNDQ